MQGVETVHRNISQFGHADPVEANMSRDCAVLISDDRLMSYALSEILSESFGFKAICELRRISDIGLAIFASAPGLVIVASALLRDDANGKLGRLRKKFGPRVQIVVLAATPDARNSKGWPADAIIDDRLIKDDFIEGIKATLRGERVVNLMAAGDEWERLAPRLDSLRPRTRQVLDLLVRGHSNIEISRLMGISEPTVKWNVSAVLAAFALRRRVHVAALFAKLRGQGVF